MTFIDTAYIYILILLLFFFYLKCLKVLVIIIVRLIHGKQLIKFQFQKLGGGRGVDKNLIKEKDKRWTKNDRKFYTIHLRISKLIFLPVSSIKVCEG